MVEIYQETINAKSPWLLQFRVTASDGFQLQLDGAPILTGNGNQVSGMISVGQGTHTATLYIVPDSHAHFTWTDTVAGQ